MNVGDAIANVNEFLLRTHSYDENEEVARRLRQLALTYDVHGKRLHDANIVATMAAHGIRTLVTQNVADFAAFDEIDTMTVTGVSIGE